MTIKKLQGRNVSGGGIKQRAVKRVDTKGKEIFIISNNFILIVNNSLAGPPLVFELLQTEKQPTKCVCACHLYCPHIKLPAPVMVNNPPKQ
jgi:hypothetical protein